MPKRWIHPTARQNNPAAAPNPSNPSSTSNSTLCETACCHDSYLTPSPERHMPSSRRSKPRSYVHEYIRSKRSYNDELLQGARIVVMAGIDTGHSVEEIAEKLDCPPSVVAEMKRCWEESPDDLLRSFGHPPRDSHADQTPTLPPRRDASPPQPQPDADPATTRRRNGELSASVRAEALAHLEAGKSIRKTAALLHCSPSTIIDTRNRHNAHGTLETLPRSGRPSKLTERDARVILREVRREPTQTYKTIMDRLGFDVSQATVYRLLKKHGIVLQRGAKPPPTPEPSATCE